MAKRDQREWKQRNRAERKAKLIYLRGGGCAHADETCEGQLELDHRRPEDKTFKISGGNLDKAWPDLLAEADKCQVLCHHHHVLKNRRDPKKYVRCCGRTYLASGMGLHRYWKHPELVQKRKKAPVAPA